MLRLTGGRTLGPAGIVWLLGVSQIVGYGTLYYSFAILADDMASSLGWPVSWLYGSFSLALLGGGFLAPLIGRRVDRHGAAAVMTAGSAVAAATLLLASLAPGAIAFTAALVVMQAAAALVLYDSAFAALVQATGSDARRRITHLTLIAGFASTLFWPLTSWLHSGLDWREILRVFAALNLFVCLPIHLVLARGHNRQRAAVGVTETVPLPAHADAVPVAPALRRRLLLLVTLGFALSNFAASAMLAQLVPTLMMLGLGSTALLVSSLFGPAQVLVRFVNMLLGVERHPMAATLVALAMTPLALLLLMATAPVTAGAIAFAVLLGFGSGLKSIVQGTLPLALFGSAAYGARLGIMASARQVLSAIAPFAFAALIGGVGGRGALGVLAAIGGLGFAALVIVARATSAGRETPVVAGA